jgi:diadenosine tetraphosphatase ApaH/serine/threonine PP2A family protein phosphatase
LTDDYVEFLKYLPLTLSEGPFTLVHGSPREPVWEYLFSPHAAQENFSIFTTPYCLIGHTHVPVIFEYGNNSVAMRDFPGNGIVNLGAARLIINPGGVGQPRDNDPRASYAIYESDENTIHHYRIEYDIRDTQGKMEKAGLPEFLISRLSIGR